MGFDIVDDEQNGTNVRSSVRLSVHNASSAAVSAALIAGSVTRLPLEALISLTVNADTAIATSVRDAMTNTAKSRVDPFCKFINFIDVMDKFLSLSWFRYL